MKGIKFLFICFIALNVISCKVSKDNIYEGEQANLLSNDSLLSIKEIIGHVESIKLVENVFEIMIRDSVNKEYKVLSKKVKDSNQSNKIVVGENYKFKIKKLTHLNLNNPSKMIIDGKEIMVSPNHYIQDCIKFNSQNFCSNSWEVYEGINLKNLNIIYDNSR